MKQRNEITKFTLKKIIIIIKREREKRNEIEILTKEVGLGRKTIGLNGTRLRED